MDNGERGMNPVAMTIINPAGFPPGFAFGTISPTINHPWLREHHFPGLSWKGILTKLGIVNLLPDKKILDWSKLKRIEDNILKCIKNGK